MIKKFENFEKSNHLIKEAFHISLGSYYRKRIESEWGLTMEDLEDILIEISDLSLYPCSIDEPSYNKYSSTLIVKSSVTQKPISFSEYKSIVHRISVELSKYNIDMEDNTIGHPKTNVDRGQYFFCLRLTKNPWGSNRRPM
jgi:hypothetical protein